MHGRYTGRLTRIVLACVCAIGSVTLAAGPVASYAQEGQGQDDEGGQRIVYPLHTSGGSIVDAMGRPVHLAAANWYGAESTDFVVGGLQAASLGDIARQVRQLGFNSVRLQWSNQMVESNPIVPDYAVAANPGLRGRHALEVFDRVVHALTAHRIMVILDNHNSTAGWCCGKDGNELWYNAAYPESSWIADWKAMAARYEDDPLVIGADLRNEPREQARWGGTDPSVDWHAAAERGGNAVLSANPNLLVVVEGVSYAGDLSGIQSLPVHLDIPGRLVYSAHDYAWYEHNFNGYDQWYAQVYRQWAYLVTGPNPQPLWVSEYGTCNTSPSCVSSTSPKDNGFWFSILTTFLQKYHVSWAYWPLNGTQSTGAGRTWNAPETYGVLNTHWDGPSSPALIQRLQEIQS